jgi:hypothetical protein
MSDNNEALLEKLQEERQSRAAEARAAALQEREAAMPTPVAGAPSTDAVKKCFEKYARPDAGEK